MKNIISKIIAGIVVCFFLFFGLKSCILVTWKSLDKPVTYSTLGIDGREFTIIFLPKFEAMIWYKDPNLNFVEGVLSKMRGSYGTHYIGPVWRVEGPRSGGLFGFKWLDKGQEPVHMEIIVLDKYIEGQGVSAFGPVGETFYAVMLKDKNRIRFHGMWLEMVDSDSDKIAALRAKFRKTG